MSLPELTLPAGLPVFRGMGHSATPRSIYATVGMRTGHARKRRVATSAPRIVTVELFLSANQMVTFDAWFENGLLAGQRAFSARVANQGPGLLWWHAEWVDPPKLTPTYGGYWALAGSLLLTGEGSVAGPVSTSAAMELIGGLVGSVTGAAVDGQAAMELTVSLALAAPVAMEITVGLKFLKNGAEPSAVDFDKRWIWMRYPYATGRTADVADVAEFDQRSWMGI